MNARYFLLLAAFSLSGCLHQGVEKPNILIILADDMGYSDLSCMGSEIRTPHIDRIATEGMLFTRFYNAARCCPTRASLLTGLYPHQAGMGDMTEGRVRIDGSHVPSYQGYLNDRSITIAEALKGEGYSTFISGKWHVGDEPEHWPEKRGFDRSFSLISGASNYFNLEPYLDHRQEIVFEEDGTRIDSTGEQWYITDAIGDKALDYLENREKGNPFFLYLAFTAPHWPVQAPEKALEEYRGSYREGWEVFRQRRYDSLLAKGILEGAELSPPFYDRPFLTPDWDTLSREDRIAFDHRMAAYAATISRMDQNVGKVLTFLEKEGTLDNTFVIFLSDNGACKAYIYLVTQWIADRSGPIGSENSFESQGAMWANVSNAPYRLFKTNTTEGGIITPMLVRYPALIDPGTLNRTPAHLIDLFPTILELTDAPFPENRNGRQLIPLPGISLVPLLKDPADATLSDRPLFWEHQGNAAVQQGKWKLVRQHGEPWHLYNIQKDPAELHDRAGQYPGIRSRLAETYGKWARDVGVVPWDSLKLKRE